MEHLISRIIALEELLESPPVDAAEQNLRGELIQYAIASSFRFRTELLLGSSMPLKEDFDCCAGRKNHREFKKLRIYTSSSKIYGREYPTTGLVHHPETHSEVDGDNR